MARSFFSSLVMISMLGAGSALAGCGETVEHAAPHGDDGAVGAAAVPTTPATGTRLAVQYQADGTAYLTDSRGRPLYTRTGAETTCEGECADAFPPVPATQPPANAGHEALDAALIGSVLRQDGRIQVTYADHPLHYAEVDAAAATAPPDAAIDRDDWALVTPDGRLLLASPAPGR